MLGVLLKNGFSFIQTRGAGRSSEVERSLMVRWVTPKLHMVIKFGLGNLTWDLNSSMIILPVQIRVSYGNPTYTD